MVGGSKKCLVMLHGMLLFYLFTSLQADQIHQLGEQIGTKMAAAEEMGAQGLVDESLKLMEEIEEIKKKKSVLEVRSQ
jgi:hypothetical protein